MLKELKKDTLETSDDDEWEDTETDSDSNMDGQELRTYPMTGSLSILRDNDSDTVEDREFQRSCSAPPLVSRKNDPRATWRLIELMELKMLREVQELKEKITQRLICLFKLEKIQVKELRYITSEGLKQLWELQKGLIKPWDWSQLRKTPTISEELMELKEPMGKATERLMEVMELNKLWDLKEQKEKTTERLIQLKKTFYNISHFQYSLD